MRSIAMKAAFCSAVVVASIDTASAQQPEPLGTEFQANAFTPSNQIFPGIALDADGDFVIAWSSFQGIAKASIFAQRFSSAGTRVGSEFQINTYTTDDHSGVKLALGSGGGFIVVWTAKQDGNSYSIAARRVTSTGTLLATEFRVNTYTSGSQALAVVASDGDGDFVVVWQGAGSTDPDGVFGRRFNSSGTAQGAEFRANGATANYQSRPAVDMDPDGDFVVTWTSIQDGDGAGVFAQRFTSSGAFTGPEFQVNVHITGFQQNSSIGIDTGGDFVIAWDDSALDGSDSGIFARRYDSVGTPLGSVFRVNEEVAGAQRYPSLATDSDGDFVVAWVDYTGPDGGDVFVRRFKSSGLSIGGDLAANTYTDDGLTQAIVASDADGDFVVTWTGYHDGSGAGVFAQRFDVSAIADIDGDGQYLPLTDGILFLRFGFGFTGATLIDDAVGPGCTRCDAPSITAHLQSLL